MITLEDFISMWHYHNDFDRVCLWEGEACTGRWLGEFPSIIIPEDYKKKVVKSFEIDTGGDHEDVYWHMIVVI